MKAVTVISPGFEEAGAEAVARFERYAEMEVTVLRCQESEAHRVKIETFAEAERHGWRVFFDADLWLLKPCAHELRQVAGPWIAGCPIPPCVGEAEAQKLGYDPRCRLTTGFVVFDPTLAGWKQAHKLALELQTHLGDDRDEIYLNTAWHRFQMPVRFIDSGWNWCLRDNHSGYTSDQIWSLHAAGISKEQKYSSLTSASAAHAHSPESWSLDEAELAWLENFARQKKTEGKRQVIEFGPGLSTLALHRAGCAVTSFETIPRSLSALSPLMPDEVTLRLYRSEPNLGGLEQSFDWAFIDGPAGSQLVDGKSRWHVLEWCAQRCDLIVLHDAKRPGEASSIRALMQAGWSAERIESERGLCVLTR